LTSNVYVEANSPYELSVPTKTLTDLSAKITGKDTTNNDFLKFPNSLPTIDDIR
jgi:hypothetical protein